MANVGLRSLNLKLRTRVALCRAAAYVSCPLDYCSYKTAHFYQFLFMGHYISYKFLLVLNQIKVNSTEILHLFECISEKAIVCVN